MGGRGANVPGGRAMGGAPAGRGAKGGLGADQVLAVPGGALAGGRALGPLKARWKVPAGGPEGGCEPGCVPGSSRTISKSS